MPWLNHEPDGGSLFPVDVDVGKRRGADQINAARRYKAAGDSDGLDGLVQSTGTDGLNLNRSLLTDYANERAGNGIGIGLSGDLQNFHGASWAAMRAASMCGWLLVRLWRKRSSG
jgi:hypothetical protein